MGQRGACARKRLFDVHGHFSLTGSARFGYGSPRGVAVPNGEFGGGRERPPVLPTGSAQRSRLTCTGVPAPVGVAPVPMIPAGRLKSQAWMARTTEVGARQGGRCLTVPDYSWMASQALP